MKVTERELNIAKLINLKNALEDCGIDVWVNEDEEFGIGFNLWNCINGNEEPVWFYLDKDEDDDIFSYVEPTTDSNALMNKLGEMIVEIS